MASNAHQTVFTRYLELHKQWSKEKEWKDHVDKLPMLLLADTIEHCTNRLISQVKASGKL